MTRASAIAEKMIPTGSPSKSSTRTAVSSLSQAVGAEGPQGGRRRGAAAGAPAGALAGNWEKPLLSGFIEGVEYTASVRGAERWEPEQR